MFKLDFNPATERYISLVTYRRNGTEVHTPVWVAQVGEKLYVFSEGEAFKVKRIRANPQAKIAPCDLRGKVSGASHEVHARIVDQPNTIELGYAALRKKYGWQMGLLNFFSGLSGKKKKRALIELQRI
jgi:uncharacterized protein